MNLTIISGGQTGVDRAALDFAIAHARELGQDGWCPKGRLAEDGIIPPCYKLREMPTSSYSARTQRNIEDSGGTLIFAVDLPLEGGTKLTADYALKIGKPLLMILQKDGEAQEELLKAFIDDHKIKRLNVAGPRASKQPNLKKFVIAVLSRWLLRQLAQTPQ